MARGLLSSSREAFRRSAFCCTAAGGGGGLRLDGDAVRLGSDSVSRLSQLPACGDVGGVRFSMSRLWNTSGDIVSSVRPRICTGATIAPARGLSRGCETPADETSLTPAKSLPRACCNIVSTSRGTKSFAPFQFSMKSATSAKPRTPNARRSS